MRNIYECLFGLRDMQSSANKWQSCQHVTDIGEELCRLHQHALLFCGVYMFVIPSVCLRD